MEYVYNKNGFVMGMHWQMKIERSWNSKPARNHLGKVGRLHYIDELDTRKADQAKVVDSKSDGKGTKMGRDIIRC